MAASVAMNFSSSLFLTTEAKDAIFDSFLLTLCWRVLIFPYSFHLAGLTSVAGSGLAILIGSILSSTVGNSILHFNDFLFLVVDVRCFGKVKTGVTASSFRRGLLPSSLQCNPQTQNEHCRHNYTWLEQSFSGAKQGPIFCIVHQI